MTRRQGSCPCSEAVAFQLTLTKEEWRVNWAKVVLEVLLAHGGLGSGPPSQLVCTPSSTYSCSCSCLPVGVRQIWCPMVSVPASSHSVTPVDGPSSLSSSQSTAATITGLVGDWALALCGGCCSRPLEVQFSFPGRCVLVCDGLVGKAPQFSFPSFVGREGRWFGSCSGVSGAFSSERPECSHFGYGAGVGVVYIEASGELSATDGEYDNDFALGSDVHHQVLVPLFIEPLDFVHL